MNPRSKSYIPPYVRGGQPPLYRPRKTYPAPALPTTTTPAIIASQVPYWLQDLDICKHRKEWENSRNRHHRQLNEERNRNRNRKVQFPPLPPLSSYPLAYKLPFLSCPTRSPVLSEHTIFTPLFLPTTGVVAPWPECEELEYEGPGRIATDSLHRRFQPIPRAPGNETVNWQQRSQIDQFPFDDFRWDMQDVAIFMRSFWVEECEISEEEGKQLLGEELMGLLDPKGEWV